MSTEQSYVGRGNYATPTEQTAEKATQAVENRPPVYPSADQQPEEVWKPIASLGFPYQISTLGRVRKAGTGKYYKLRVEKGIRFVIIKRQRKAYFITVHQEMAKAFIANPNGYYFVRFIDDNPANLTVANLAWHSTKKESLYRPQKPRESYLALQIEQLKQTSQLTAEDSVKADIISASDDCMSPMIPLAARLLIVPINPPDYASLGGKVVVVVVKAKRFAFYLGRVVSITDEEVRVSRDNSEWSDRTESRSVIARIARVVSVLEAPVH